VIENENQANSFQKEMLDVGIKGVSKLPLKKSKGNFNLELKFPALKFDSTSYNSEVFYFLLFLLP